jgi:hypothetical protein
MFTFLFTSSTTRFTINAHDLFKMKLKTERHPITTSIMGASEKPSLAFIQIYHAAQNFIPAISLAAAQINIGHLGHRLPLLGAYLSLFSYVLLIFFYRFRRRRQGPRCCAEELASSDAFCDQPQDKKKGK